MNFEFCQTQVIYNLIDRRKVIGAKTSFSISFKQPNCIFGIHKILHTK